MRVKVKQCVQVAHEGKAFDNEETIDAPVELVRHWLRSGWVDEVKLKARSS